MKVKGFQWYFGHQWLSLCGQKQWKHSLKYLLLCFTEKGKSCRFGTTESIFLGWCLKCVSTRYINFTHVFSSYKNGAGVSQTSKRHTQSYMYHLSIEIPFSDSTITLDYYRQYYCDSSLELLCISLKCRGNFPHRLHCTLIWVTFVFPSHLLSFCRLFFQEGRSSEKI